MSQRRLPPPVRYVYVIGPETGLQKIGMATDPRARLAALQTASPFKLMIHASVVVPFGAAHDVERRAHEALRHVWAAGEWFGCTPADAAAAVRGAAGAHQPVAVGNGTLPLFAFAEGATACDPQGATHGRHVATNGLVRLWKAARRGLAVG